MSLFCGAGFFCKNFKELSINKSNKQIGAKFERQTQECFKSKGIILELHKKIEIGYSAKIVKKHEFDLGNDEILVECKSSSWTKEDHVPSAKITNWNCAMYYFHLASKKIKKYFVVKKYCSKKRNNMTLLDFYLEYKSQFIPTDVILIELDENLNARIFAFDGNKFSESKNYKF